MIAKTEMANMKQFFKNQRHNLREIAMEFGFIPSTSKYTKFIILGRSRTGSNFLRGLLNSHPKVLVLGEIFRNKDTIDFDHPEYFCSEKILHIYQNDPEKFLNTVVFRKIPAEYQALGFKLFYYHAAESPYSLIWDRLKELSDLHIIHIKRKNILRTHLSRENAVKTGQWVNTNGKETQTQSYRLDYESLKKDFVQTRQWEDEADNFFSAHPKIEVIYEELSHNTEQEVNKIQRFLNLPEHPVQAQTYKQIQKPLSEIIENYDELKLKFRDTEWAVFFDD